VQYILLLIAYIHVAVSLHCHSGVPTYEDDRLLTCWDEALYYALLARPFLGNGRYNALLASLWCRDILTLEAARELDEQSECLQCLPEHIRPELIESLKWASLGGEYLLLYMMEHCAL
jgi:hypothetical protein